MTLLQSVFLGIIQGLTEFLPVSSSGHLAIVQNLFHVDTGDSVLFDILLHLGTLAVVFIVFRRDILMLIRAFFGMIGDMFANIGISRSNARNKEQKPLRRIVKTNYRKFAVLVIVATIPTAIIGFAGKKLVSDASSTLLVPGILLLVTGVLLFLSDRAKNCVKIPQDITYREGLIVGIAQGFATLPGLSRSGSTITAALMCGFDRMFAVKYSFILSIPAILGAAVLEIKDVAWGSVSASQIGIYAAGVLCAGIVGYICIRFMLMIVRKRKLKYIAFYCFAIGAVAIAAHFFM
ncbi:MAG: undecaprenyl-diphosphate phosphatase [Lachnospiraceae bacterium]|nr:undecaprenyl-diphosphate phosphatase [Lachnospiraceae bacterium]